MLRTAQTTIDPRAFDLLIDEGFIRQADLVKAIQDSLNQRTDLEGVLIKKYRVPKAALGKTLGSISSVLIFHMTNGPSLIQNS